MKTKSEFITVKPKTEEAKMFFDVWMRQLHSCKVLERQTNKVLLNSIAGDYKFWMNIEGDKNWEVIR
jgi:hypothetical protein